MKYEPSLKAKVMSLHLLISGYSIVSGLRNQFNFPGVDTRTNILPPSRNLEYLIPKEHNDQP